MVMYAGQVDETAPPRDLRTPRTPTRGPDRGLSRPCRGPRVTLKGIRATRPDLSRVPSGAGPPELPVRDREVRRDRAGRTHWTGRGPCLRRADGSRVMNGNYSGRRTHTALKVGGALFKATLQAVDDVSFQHRRAGDRGAGGGGQRQVPPSPACWAPGDSYKPTRARCLRGQVAVS